eukprot:scaffold5151_cov125-Isochrysis_galbana.AAC.1
MEQTPADARAAPSASEPNDIDMGIPSSPKRPRDPAQGNMKSQRATPNAPAMLESQPETTESLSSDPARACQSLAHHTTLTGRSHRVAAQPYNQPKGSKKSKRQLSTTADFCRRHTTPSRESRDPDTTSSKEQAPLSTISAHSSGAERILPQTVHDSLRETSQRQTAHRTQTSDIGLRYTQKIHNLTLLHPLLPQKGKSKAPPRPPPIAEEVPEEGDDPNFNFVSDTNNLITIKQKGPVQEIRDTDMGAALTYLLLDLEGVDTEPDILDDGKKGGSILDDKALASRGTPEGATIKLGRQPRATPPGAGPLGAWWYGGTRCSVKVRS